MAPGSMFPGTLQNQSIFKSKTASVCDGLPLPLQLKSNHLIIHRKRTIQARLQMNCNLGRITETGASLVRCCNFTVFAESLDERLRFSFCNSGGQRLAGEEHKRRSGRARCHLSAVLPCTWLLLQPPGHTHTNSFTLAPNSQYHECQVLAITPEAHGPFSNDFQSKHKDLTLLRRRDVKCNRIFQREL